MAYDAVLFDNDGVLVEPTPWDEIRGAIRSAFHRLGVDDPAERHVDRLIGVEVEDVREVADAYDLDPEALWRERDTAASEAQRAILRDGGKPAYDDVDAVEALPAPRAVVSNNQLATVEAVLDEYDLGSLFEAVYGREPTLADVAHKKPNPYFLERALADLDASDALFVGDSPTDLEAARRAGVDAAFVRRPHREEAAVPYEPAYEVADLHELRDRIA